MKISTSKADKILDDSEGLENIRKKVIKIIDDKRSRYLVSVAIAEYIHKNFTLTAEIEWQCPWCNVPATSATQLKTHIDMRHRPDSYAPKNYLTKAEIIDKLPKELFDEIDYEGIEVAHPDLPKTIPDVYEAGYNQALTDMKETLNE